MQKKKKKKNTTTTIAPDMIEDMADLVKNEESEPTYEEPLKNSDIKPENLDDEGESSNDENEEQKTANPDKKKRKKKKSKIIIRFSDDK